MPNWKIHLEIGKRLNNYLHFKDNDYEEFLLGNILPDINNGYIVRDIEKRISHAITHFDNGRDFKHHVSFLNKYYSFINKPIYLGYYVHLYTDYLFNNDFYTKINLRKINNLDKEELKIMKQDDFKLFNNKYVDNIIKLDNINNTLENIKIEEIEIYPKDIENVLKYLNNTPLFHGDYQFYKEEELDELLKNTINKIYNNLLKEGIICE